MFRIGEYRTSTLCCFLNIKNIIGLCIIVTLVLTPSSSAIMGDSNLADIEEWNKTTIKMLTVGAETLTGGLLMENYEGVDTIRH